MESRIAFELKLRYQPVAILFTDDIPQEAMQFQKGRWGCVAAMLTAAAKGATVAFDRSTYGCAGGGVGLGFGDTFAEDICHFLSTGGSSSGREGEGYFKDPEIAGQFVSGLPVADIPYTYVVFKPLKQVDAILETPVLVCFYCNPDQLSALVVLANYDRPHQENVILPMASGCQSTCLIPYRESLRDTPRAVVGTVDISARPHVDPDILTFTVPYRMMLEMESNIPGSFVELSAWAKISARIPAT